MTAMSGSSQQSTLKKGAPGDQVYRPGIRAASQLPERGQLMPLHLHMIQKSNYDDGNKMVS